MSLTTILRLATLLKAEGQTFQHIKQKNMDSHHNTSKIQTNPLVTKCRTTDQLYHSEFAEYLSFSEYIS
jgi:hypothetical protein